MGTRHLPPLRALLRAGFARCGGGTRASGGGAPLAWVWGVRGRALPHARPSVLWGVRPGPATHWLWVRGVRAWGPVTKPNACALASCLCALWGQHEGARGGRLLPGCQASGVGALRPRTAPPLGRAAGPSTHWLWVQGGWAWGPVTNPTARALASWLGALWGRQEGAWRGHLLPGCWASEVGRSPNPDRSSFGACGWGPLPTGCGCRCVGVGTRHQPHSAHSCELAFCPMGAAGGRPGGAPLAWVCGVCRRALSHPRPPLIWGVRLGPTTQWLWVQGVWAWGPITHPTARALASWLCALWGRH